MKAGDIVFFRNKGLIPWLIRKVSGGYYNHVAIALSENLLLEAEYNSNTCIRNISFYHAKGSEIKTIPMNITNEQLEMIYKITDEYYSTKFYDMKLICKMFLKYVFAIPFTVNTQEKVVCSELVAMVLLDAKITDDFQIINFSPQELYDWLVLKNGKA